MWGDLVNGIKLNQPIKKISNFDELIDQINNGLISGDFQSIQFFSEGEEFFKITGNQDQWNFISGGAELKLTGDLPTNIMEIFGLFGLVRNSNEGGIFGAYETSTSVTTTNSLNSFNNGASAEANIAFSYICMTICFLSFCISNYAKYILHISN